MYYKYFIRTFVKLVAGQENLATGKILPKVISLALANFLAMHYNGPDVTHTLEIMSMLVLWLICTVFTLRHCISSAAPCLQEFCNSLEYI